MSDPSFGHRCFIDRMNGKIRKMLGIIYAHDIGWLRALMLAVAAGVEHKRVMRSLGQVRTVVDVGANRGQFALAARHCFPHARIISFEPLRGPAQKFRRVFARDSGVELHQAAIGPEAGTSIIYISRSDDASSLLPITTIQEQLYPGTAQTGTETTHVGPLDDFISLDRIETPALLKIDVQGYELEVLRGCEQLLNRFDHIYAECSFVELYEGQPMAYEIIGYLAKRDFRLIGVYNMHYDRQGRAVQGDLLFSRPTRKIAKTAHC